MRAKCRNEARAKHSTETLASQAMTLPQLLHFGSPVETYRSHQKVTVKKYDNNLYFCQRSVWHIAVASLLICLMLLEAALWIHFRHHGPPEFSLIIQITGKSKICIQDCTFLLFLNICIGFKETQYLHLQNLGFLITCSLYFCM